MPESTEFSTFINYWGNAGGAERANYQLFLIGLCELLKLPRPDPTTPDDAKNNYVFDRSITATNPDGTPTTNFIDLYKRAHFVIEAKQGVEKESPQSGADAPVGPPLGTPISRLAPSPRKHSKLKKGHGVRNTPLWNDALLRAKSQAENYVRNIPDDTPPFLLVVDVGYQLETYADFSGLGKTYTPFPDNLSHRFKLTAGDHKSLTWQRRNKCHDGQDFDILTAGAI